VDSVTETKEKVDVFWAQVVNKSLPTYHDIQCSNNEKESISLYIKIY